MQLVWPSREYLPAYTEAVRRGWSPNVRGPSVANAQLEHIQRDPDGFLAALAEGKPRPAVRRDGGEVCAPESEYRWWIWDGEVCGAIGIRWRPASGEALAVCLGIGYSVVPWRRREGYATRALGALLPIAKAEGLSSVELTTDFDNIASRRVIAANGGVQVEDFREPPELGGGRVLRFRIAT